MKVKLKNGVEKEISDLTQEELKSQKEFVKIKNIQKKQDQYALIYQVNCNKEKIEQLQLSNQRIQEEIERLASGRKALKLLDTLLNKYLKTPAQVLFENTWGQFSAEQAEEGEECNEKEFNQLSTLIKKK